MIPPPALPQPRERRGQTDAHTNTVNSSWITDGALTTGEGICRSHDILIKPASTPDLAWDERTAQNSNEEADSIETGCVFDKGRQTDGNASEQQNEAEHLSRAKLVAERARDKTHEQSGRQGHNVGVGHLGRGKMEVRLDGDGELVVLLLSALVPR